MQNRKSGQFYTIWAKKHPYQCIIVHLCTIATVTVHKCTATVACAFYILIVFDSLLFFSLSSSSAKLTLPLMFSFPLIPHIPIDTKSKINYKNQKSTTKSTKKKSTKKINHWNKIVGSVVLMEIGDGLMLIGFDGDRWWVEEDQCWWRSVLMECL